MMSVHNVLSLVLFSTNTFVSFFVLGLARRQKSFRNQVQILGDSPASSWVESHIAGGLGTRVDR